jgi:selenocysteine lyase/cysteine desulfurase
MALLVRPHVLFWKCCPSGSTEWYFGIAGLHLALFLRESDFFVLKEIQLVRWMVAELFPLQVYTIRELAKFVGASPMNIFLVDNATSGMNAILRSLEFNKDDSIVYLSLGYDAIINAMKYISLRHGVQLIPVEVKTPIVIQKILDDLEKTIQPNTKLVVVDHITSSSGLLLPIKKIIGICHKKNVPIAVDGAHSIGHIPLNLQELGADFYVANCHKWMYSCKGSAFLYVVDQFKDKIHPPVISNFYGQGPNAEFLWSGTVDFSPKLSILTALEFYNRLGGERIRNYCHTLAVKAGTMLAKMWNTRLILSEEGNGDYTQYLGNMVAIKLPVPYKFVSSEQMTGHSQWLHSTLWNKYKIEVPITVVNQELYVRISAQIFNELDEYLQLGTAIQEIYKLS